MDTRKMTSSAMLISLGVLLGNLIYIPIGASKCFPVQHTINVISAVTLGPVYSTVIAFLISLIRNIIGTGSLLAFPGSMIGALLAGLLYKFTGNRYLTTIGEIFGTGILGGLAAYPIAKYIMGSEVVVFFFVYPFLLSTMAGGFIGLLMLRAFDQMKTRKTII